MRSSVKSGLLLATASLLVSLALAEVGLRLFVPLADPYAPWKRQFLDVRGPGGSEFVPSAFPAHYRIASSAEPGLYGMDERVRVFEVNNLGFRGDSLAMPKPADELRVFVVGGSTTECILLSGEESLTGVLQRELNDGRGGPVRVRVYGAGKSGDRSFDHVAMVAHRIAHLQPDVVIVFAGINDLLIAGWRRDYLMRASDGPGTRLGITQLARAAATELRFPRLVYRAWTRVKWGRPNVSGYRQAIRQHEALPLATQPPPTDIPPYAENLATLAAIARAQGATPVFMTQASTWGSPDPRASEWSWMAGKFERYPPAQMRAALERYNDAMRAVAAEHDVPVFDLVRAVPETMDYFYDDVHFNIRGADTAGTLLGRFLQEQGIVPRAQVTSE